MKNPGEQFLHKKDNVLYTTEPVEHEAARRRRAGERVSQEPADNIANWLSVIEKTHLGHRDDPRVQERIKKYYHNRYVIKQEDIPESYYRSQQRQAKEIGHGNIEITKEVRAEYAKTARGDQISTLDNWINYFTGPDSGAYPTWAKYWAFTNMLRLSGFDKEKHAFAKREKTTVAPFPDLNREALAYVVNAIVKSANKKEVAAAENNPEFKKLLAGANFGKLYAHAIESITPTETKELLSTAGKWTKYQRGSDHMPLVASLQGHGTGWCTAGETTAETQLANGDFYVYYSYDKDGRPKIPRVAIRMDDTKIAEVRGIAAEQNLDPYIGDVVDGKLAEFPDGEEYKKKTADMKRLTEIDKRHASGGELTKEDLRFLYQLDSKIQGFGYKEDPRIQALLDYRDIRTDLSSATGFSKEQISLTKEEAVRGGIKLHYGELILSTVKTALGLSLPEKVCGDVYLNGLVSAVGLKLPEEIIGDLSLSGLKSALGLKLPDVMKGGLSLGSLESAEELTLPQIIEGNLDLGRLKSVAGLKLPKVLGGSVHLISLTSAVGLEFPQTVGGDIGLDSLKSAIGLKLPKRVGNGLYLAGLKSTEGLILPETVGFRVYLTGITLDEKKEEIINKYPDLTII